MGRNMRAKKSREPGAPDRRRAEHLGPERRRPLVLDAALKLFVERGYDGTSMDAIAQAAGVTKPVVYACYPSKEELFAALLDREEERALGQIASVLPASPDPGNPEAMLAEAFTTFFRAVADSPDTYRVIVLGEGGAAAGLVSRVNAGRERLIDVIAALARSWLEDRAASTDPDLAARLIGYSVVALAEAGARAILSEPERWTPETLGTALASVATRGERGL